MDAPRTRDWFLDEELEPCPRCKAKTAVVTPDIGAVVCTECGFVGFKAAGKA